MKLIKRMISALLAAALLLPALPVSRAIRLDWPMEGEWTVDLTDRLPVELEAVSVRELLGEERYAACVEKYGADAVVSRSDEYSTGEETVEGGLNGTINYIPEFYAYHLYNDALMVSLRVGAKGTDLASGRDTALFYFDIDMLHLDRMLKFTAKLKPDAGTPSADASRQGTLLTTGLGMTKSGEISGGLEQVTLYTPPEEFPRGGSAGFRVSFADGFDAAGMQMRAYSGLYYAAEDIPQDAEEVTDYIMKGCTTNYRDRENNWYAENGNFTIVLSRGDVVQTLPVKGLRIYSQTKLFYPTLYANDGLARVGLMSDGPWEDGVRTYSYTFEEGSDYVADASYWLHLRYQDWTVDDGTGTGEEKIKAAYVGRFDGMQEAQASGAEDVKSSLFASASGFASGGYRVNLNGKGVTFTIIDYEDEVHHLRFVTRGQTGTGPDSPEPPETGAADTYFSVVGAYAGGRYLSTLFYNQDDRDSYYRNGYQTVFLLNQDGSPVEGGTEISPHYLSGGTVSIYAGGTNHVGETVRSGERQTSKESTVTLENGPVTTVQYSAAAENNICLKNYWVSFVTQSSGGPRLFVPGVSDAMPAHRNAAGIPYRIAALDPAHGYYHDIFVANIGDAPAEDLKVELTDAVGVELDQFWNGNGASLDAFTPEAVPDGALTAMPSCAARVRLVPAIGADGQPYEGEISGRLTISTADGGSVTMELTGMSTGFAFQTDAMRDAVRYVPYDQAVQTSAIGSAAGVRSRVTAGTLPLGLSLYQNGVIYGVPTCAPGSYTFTVAASLSRVSLGLPDETAEREFTIRVLDNTDSSVWTATDVAEAGSEDDCRITVAIPNRDGSTGNIDQGGTSAGTGANDWSNQCMTLKTEGVYARFRNVYLDGRRLRSGEDYTSEEGSTVITLQTQTLERAGSGTHTIAAEFFRTSGNDGTLRRAAQNYTIPMQQGAGADKPGQTVQRPQTAGTGFSDVSAADWFYADAAWASGMGYMNGVGGGKFQPHGAVDMASAVTALANAGGVSLEQFAGESYDNITAGQWYANAAVWASQAGILPDGAVFQEAGVLRRGEIAVMLVKYLRGAGVNVVSDANSINFSDAALMRKGELEAFRTLCGYGIFQGLGNGRMDPDGITTRAQFAALLHRVYNTANS